jgi:predicted nucleic-acid-binding Zn-ribbon protein
MSRDLTHQQLEHMPPFDPAARCPKCGGEDISTWHVEGHHCSRCMDGGTPEHLVRTCRRCSYKWGESVLEPPSLPAEPKVGDDSTPPEIHAAAGTFQTVAKERGRFLGFIPPGVDRERYW